MRVSSYLKLRLSPEDVRVRFENEGFVVRHEPGLRWMVRLIADV